MRRSARHSHDRAPSTSFPARGSIPALHGENECMLHDGIPGSELAVTPMRAT
jgi:hypothetical protein